MQLDLSFDSAVGNNKAGRSAFGPRHNFKRTTTHCQVVSPFEFQSLTSAVLLSLWTCGRTGKPAKGQSRQPLQEPWARAEIHQTLRITPAMAAGVTDRLWDMSDIVRLVEEMKAANLSAERSERAERSYNPFGDALGGHGLPKK